MLKVGTKVFYREISKTRKPIGQVSVMDEFKHGRID